MAETKKAGASRPLLKNETCSAVLYTLIHVNATSGKPMAQAVADVAAMLIELAGHISPERLDVLTVAATKGLRMIESGRIVIGPRDRNMNKAHSGSWMVAEKYEPGHVQDDGRGGVWCVVGNDLSDLISVAYDTFMDGGL